MVIRILIFLIINFGGLAIGSYFTGNGVSSEWYQQLHKAPWTPPGWVFGFAWTTIMLCFSLYMSLVWKSTNNQLMLLSMFVISWILNVLWNPVFFHFQFTTLGLAIILLLTLVIGWFLFATFHHVRYKVILVAPYFLWLLIATSLNAFIVFKN
ncbi:MAG TPA: TspO protein [Bacteroidales bacterium]|jgi:benzodiazapine receptor|nr:TspO protein [Bacteroidales bacterium]